MILDWGHISWLSSQAMTMLNLITVETDAGVPAVSSLWQA